MRNWEQTIEATVTLEYEQIAFFCGTKDVQVECLAQIHPAAKMAKLQLKVRNTSVE